MLSIGVVTLKLNFSISSRFPKWNIYPLSCYMIFILLTFKDVVKTYTFFNLVSTYPADSICVLFDLLSFNHTGLLMMYIISSNHSIRLYNEQNVIDILSILGMVEDGLRTLLSDPRGCIVSPLVDGC